MPRTAPSLLALAALLAAVATASPAGAQISADPEVPSVDAPVTITFNAAGTGLEGFSGDVFAHTGLVTDQSANDTDWRYVKNNWADETTGDVQLARVTQGVYQLRIEDIRAYYSDNSTGAGAVPESEVIQKLAFVFRNDDGTQQSQDLFVDVAPSVLSVSILSPDLNGVDPAFATSSTGPEVRATATPGASGAIASMAVTVDGTVVATSTTDEITHTLALDPPGRYTVGVRATTDDARETTETFTVVRNPDVVTEARPAGLQDGITYGADGTSATLSLFAPYKDFAYVIGDFTNWEVDTDYFMKRDVDGADSTWYWIEIDGLTPGTEYAFQYLVDGEIRVADPYVEKVLTRNDQFISAETYPGLQPYPGDQTDHVVGVLQPGEAEYDWQVEDFEAPDPSELVIYELLLRDFLAAHDYETLADTLDYIARLGVNAIELMPVSEFDGNESWGYNPSFHFALDKYYGPEEDFKAFVDAAHQRGLAVLLDVAYNHATGQSPLIRLWNEGDFGDPTAENPYANTAPRHPFNVFNDLNHESAATQYWLDRANRFWLEEYRVDGFRFDLTKGFTQTQTCNDQGGDCDVTAWSSYDQSRVDLLTRMTDEIWEVDADAIVIFEHLGVNDEEEVYAEYRTNEGFPGVLLWSNLNDNYAQSVMGYQDRSDFSWVHYSNRPGWETANNVAYMESHDEERIMYKALQFGNSSGDYSTKDLGTALDRFAMAGAFFYTVPGPKMLWQFGEVGYDVSIDFNGRTGNKPILWDEYWIQEDAEAAMRQDLYDAWARVIGLRNAHDLFTDPETAVDMDVDGLVKRITLDHPSNGEDALIVGNFDVVGQQVSYTFPTTGTWYDVYGGGSFEVTDATRQVTLAPGEFYVYTSMEPGNVTGPVDAGDDGATDRFALGQSRPNPFATSATIDYALDQTGPVRLDVFDALGRRVATLVDGVRPAGSHTATLAAGDLPSGLYVYRLEAGGRVATQRMVLAR
jgi:1,4-alpha-glucan branching enzyme